MRMIRRRTARPLMVDDAVQLLTQLRSLPTGTERRAIAAQRDRFVAAINQLAATSPDLVTPERVSTWAAEVNEVCCDRAGLLPVLRTGRRVHVARALRVR
ncbi:MAG: hypothetical protein NVS3B26_22530 [Mycobacteriales bacterium]